ncbi:MAG: PQQ-binding-like beta-propeller repeat protein, partial [Thermoplasmata archaeon]
MDKKIFPVVFGLVLAGLFLGLITFTSDSAEGEGLADTPWPCYRGNLNNTALSPYNTSLINGTLKWSFSTGGWVYSSPSIGSDGTIYFGSDDQNFYALYPNGTLKWSFLTGDWVRSSPAIATDGTIYFISYDRYFYALYPNGTLKWTYPIVGWVPYSPTIDNNGIIYFGTSHVDDKLYALYPNGTLKWTFKTEHDVSSKPVIGTDGIIYFCSLDENIYALYPNGTLKWSHNSNPIYDSPAISQDGIIYFGTSSGEFFALYLNGTEKWNITIGECVQSSCAIDADGIIYVGSYDNNLYALYPNSTVKWTFLTGDNVISCPSIGADGTIYFGSNDHNIYALYPNGMLKWNYTTGDWIWGSPTIGGDGNIYVPSKDGNLYAFGSTFAPPSAPQNLQAIAGNGYVKLTWDPPIFEGSFPITNYTIYRGTASGSEIFLIEVGNVTNYNDTSVLNGIRYYYIVKARNIVGDGPFSNEVDAMPIGWPSTPQDLQTSSGDSYIDLDWSAPITDGGGPITNYRIYKGTSPGALTFYVELGDVQFYHDIVVTNGITYYYKVSAVNNLGEGPLSNEASATPGTVPEAPLNLQAAAGNRYVNLSWDEPSYDGGFPIINYTIYRGTVSSGEEFLLEIGNLTNYNDTNVENCIRYYYKVKAKNALGEGAFSNEANDVPLGPPLDPQNLSAESGDSYVYLTWDAPESDGGSSITNYRIYRGTTSDEVALFMEIGDVQFFNDTNVTNRITYYYNVSAVNGIGEGLLSNETNATPASNLTAPQNLQANAGDGFVNLTWDPPASDGDFSIINYSIYKGTTSDDEIFYIEIQNVTYYEDTNVLNGIRYYYKV